MKQKLSFTNAYLKSLINSEDSAVKVHKNYRGKLEILPFHLGYLKEAVKELLDTNVSKYNMELDGIILGYNNIKIFNFPRQVDHSSTYLVYIADVYVFAPYVGSCLKGVVNKKSKEHIGVLVNKAFNVSVQKPDGKFKNKKNNAKWKSVHSKANIGDTLSFTISEIDMTFRLPYIKGVIDCSIDTDEVDSGFEHESIEEECENIKSSQVQDESSYHDPTDISQLFFQCGNMKPEKSSRKKRPKVDLDESNQEEGPPKKRRKKNLLDDTSCETPESTVKTKKRAKQSVEGLRASLLNQVASALSPLRTEGSDVMDGTESPPKVKKKKHKEILNGSKSSTSPKIDPPLITSEPSITEPFKKFSKMKEKWESLDNLKTSLLNDTIASLGLKKSHVISPSKKARHSILKSETISPQKEVRIDSPKIKIELASPKRKKEKVLSPVQIKAEPLFHDESDSTTQIRLELEEAILENSGTHKHKHKSSRKSHDNTDHQKEKKKKI